MANLDSPRGLWPIKNAGGGVAPVMQFGVDSDNAAAIFIGSPVIAEADGKCAIATAGIGDALIGVVVGIEDTNHNPVGSYNSAVSESYLPASTAGYLNVALALPGALFGVQSETGFTTTAADVFRSCDLTAESGSTTLGKSTVELDGTSGTDKQCAIVGKIDEPNNAWGAHSDLIVVFKESYWFDATASI